MIAASSPMAPASLTMNIKSLYACKRWDCETLSYLSEAGGGLVLAIDFDSVREYEHTSVITNMDLSEYSA
jgi:hypothetical protein